MIRLTHSSKYNKSRILWAKSNDFIERPGARPHTYRNSMTVFMSYAERAQQMAGLAEKPSGIHGQLLVLQQFNLQEHQPYISSLDLASNPSKQPPLHTSQIDTPVLEAAGGPADGDGQLDGERPSEGSQRH